MENKLEEQDADLLTLSLSEKLAHKSWKARKLGLEELARIMECADASDEACFLKYKEALSKFPSDANVPVAEAALKVILVYALRWKVCTRFRAQVLPLIITKCLCSSRASLSSISLEVILAFIESSSSSNFVLEKLVEALTCKTPRVVSSALCAIRSSLKVYGSGVINLKYILRNTTKCFEHKDKQIREKAAALMVEIYRWDRNLAEDIYSNLKPVQIKELMELFSQIPDDPPVPLRALRRELPNSDVQITAGIHENSANEGLENVVEEKDPYDTAKAIVILKDPALTPLIESLDAADWKARKESLDRLLNMFSVMKIESDNFWPIVKKLVKRMADTNIYVCASAAECLCALCLGLRSSFAVYKSHVLGAVIEKLKEKKKIVLDQLRQLLDSIFLVSGEFTSIMGNLEEGAIHKNPQVRAEVILWIVRSLKVYKDRLEKQTAVQLLDISLKTIVDSDKIVREHAAELIACVAKLSGGETLIKSFGSKIEKQKIARVVEYFNTVELGLPTKYESEEYIISRGYTPLGANKLNRLVSEVDKIAIEDSRIHSTSEHEHIKVKTPSVDEFMDTDNIPSRELPSNLDSEIGSDKFYDAHDNTSPPVILYSTVDEKLKRTVRSLDVNMLVSHNLKMILHDNAKNVLSDEVRSLISNIDLESEANIIDTLEKILQPISQRPESLVCTASQIGISQDDLEERYINGSDVLFLLSIFLFSNKTYSITMRCLLLIQTLLCLLNDKDCELSDYEAKALSFALLSGVNCENNDMDTMVSALFRKLSRTFPVSVIFGYACDVLECYPNSRKLCLEEIIHLVRRGNSGCYCPEKIVPLTAKLLLDRDPCIRKNAITLINVIHSKILKSIYGYLNNAPESVLHAVKMHLSKSEIPSETGSSVKILSNSENNLSGALVSSSKSITSDTKQVGVDTSAVQTPSFEDSKRNVLAMSPLLYYHKPTSVTKEDLSDISPEISSIIARLTLRDHLHKIAALKELEKIMSDEFDAVITSSCIRILTSNLLCELKYAISYILNDKNTIGRLCKHLISALAKIFCCSAVRSLDENTLKQTFIGMLDLLLELSFIDAEPCQQLSKVLNVLVIRILDNADRTQSFKVLITILREFLVPELQLSSKVAVKHRSIAELVMKCLWKITKNMDFLIKENKVDVAQLLLNCHQFLEAVPPIEWKRRAHKHNLFQEELPLKTVKTIMKELVKSLGDDILLYANHIPYPDQSYAVSYIRQVLKSGK